MTDGLRLTEDDARGFTGGQLDQMAAQIEQFMQTPAGCLVAHALRARRDRALASIRTLGREHEDPDAVIAQGHYDLCDSLLGPGLGLSHSLRCWATRLNAQASGGSNA